MGKFVGKITVNNVVFSIFDNDTPIDGKIVPIRNIKIERCYKENGKWLSNNYFSEKALQNLSLAIQKYNNKDFDKKKDDNAN